MILRITVVVVVLIGAVLVLAAMKPNTFHLERSITIKAPPKKIYALIDDFHNWSTWEPQDKGDAGIQRTYSGPAAGVGAMSEWQGSGSTGKRPNVDHRIGPERQGFCCGGFRTAISGS